MRPTCTVSIPDIARLIVLSSELIQDAENVHTLRLGSFASRAQHTGTSPLTLAPSDSQELATLISSFPNLEDVECGDVRWKPTNTTALLPVATNAALVHAVRPVEATEAAQGGSTQGVQDHTTSLALPKNGFVNPIAGADTRGQHDVRVVQVCAIPLAAASGAASSLASGGDFREVVIHVTDAASIATVHDFIFDNGASVFDLTLRWCDTSALRGIPINALVRELDVARCMSLSSLTLVHTLIPGEASVARMQWQLNLAVVRSVVSPDLRRLRIVIQVEEDGGCDKTWGQVKQTRWQDLAMELDQFANLQKVEVVVVGEGSEDSEIWQEIEQRLRGTLPRDVRLVRGHFCIL